MKFMTHLIGGYPSLEANVEMLDAYEAAGVEYVEIQFPFSEPIADGPLFAQGNQLAIEAGVKHSDVFDLLKMATSKYSFKVLMMGYYNTVFRQGEKEFCQKLKDCGAWGMIVPDVPIEESTYLQSCAYNVGLEWIPLVAPTSTKDRIQKISDVCEQGQGFVYAVARKGTTGKKTDLDSSITKYLKLLQETFTMDIAVGFGISERSHIETLTGNAEIAVIGSAGLRAYQEGGKTALLSLLQNLQGKA